MAELCGAKDVGVAREVPGVFGWLIPGNGGGTGCLAPGIGGLKLGVRGPVGLGMGPAGGPRGRRGSMEPPETGTGPGTDGPEMGGPGTGGPEMGGAGTGGPGIRPGPGGRDSGPLKESVGPETNSRQ